MSYLLQNEILDVEIGHPNEFYTGSRFDLSGNIIQITMDKKHTFCSTEKNQYNSCFGFGLLNEFDIEKPDNFSSAQVGKLFHKIGVGTLLKEKPTYDFFHPYTKKELQYEVKQRDQNQIKFETKSENIREMQYEYSKIISISGNHLTISYCLKNTGSIPFKTEEYCHNFLCINKDPLSEHCSLEFDFNIEPTKFKQSVNITEQMNFEKNSLRWSKPVAQEFFIDEINAPAQKCRKWQFINWNEKLGVSEEIDFDCSKVNLWGNSHVFSPELFAHWNIKPGQEKNWSRSYKFFTL